MSGSSTPYPAAQASRPPLRRVRDERLIAGVCSGIARTLGMPTLAVRLIALAAGVILPPLALVAYAGLAVAIPRDDGRNLLAGDPPDRRETVIGWAIIVAGLIAVAAGLHSSFVAGPGGFILLAAGVVMLVVHHQRRTPTNTTTTPDGAAPTSPTVHAEAVPTLPFRHALPYPTSPRHGGATPPVATFTTTVTPPPAHTPPAPPAGPRERSIGLFGFAAVLAGTAVTSILAAAGAIDVSGTGLAIAFGAGALALTAGAVIWARRRGAVSLIALAVVLAMGSLLAAAAGDHLEYGIGERTITPITPAELAAEHRFGAGQFTIDLTRYPIPAGTSTIRGRLGFGELVIRVPDDVTVISNGPTGIESEGTATTGSPEKIVSVIADVDHGDARVERVAR